MQLDDVMGLPVRPNSPRFGSSCGAGNVQQEECVKIALESHPEVVAAREELKKASAAVRSAKADYFPDFSAFARYSYRIEFRFSRATLGPSARSSPMTSLTAGKGRPTWAKAMLGSHRHGKTSLASRTMWSSASRRLEQTSAHARNDGCVAGDCRAADGIQPRRGATSRKGEALQSQAETAVAQEFDAKTPLLQAQLGYVQAKDEMIHAIGRTP